jgi:ABC-type branched-subunit amino acid transport system ATPase component
MSSTAILETEGVSVRFGGVVANDAVSIRCAEGSITALIGPNGAGKSTLFDVVTGGRRPDEGRVLFRGHDITKASRVRRANLGMGRTFQNLQVVRSMTVLENVMVGTFRYHRYGLLAAMFGTPKVQRSERELKTIAMRALRTVGLDQIAHLSLDGLPYGDLRRIEVARALALGPQLLMLDEPAAGMDRQETDELAEAIREICRRWEVSVLVVEHDIPFIRAVAQDVYVLDFGRILAGGEAESVLSDPTVIEAYLGTVHA